MMEQILTVAAMVAIAYLVYRILSKSRSVGSGGGGTRPGIRRR